MQFFQFVEMFQFVEFFIYRIKKDVAGGSTPPDFVILHTEYNIFLKLLIILEASFRTFISLFYIENC